MKGVEYLFLRQTRVVNLFQDLLHNPSYEAIEGYPQISMGTVRSTSKIKGSRMEITYNREAGQKDSAKACSILQTRDLHSNPTQEPRR